MDRQELDGHLRHALRWARVRTALAVIAAIAALLMLLDAIWEWGLG
jgi:hypothetical protein